MSQIASIIHNFQKLKYVSPVGMLTLAILIIAVVGVAVA